MVEINIYEKPTCTTCKKAVTLLKEKGIEFNRINYFIEPFTKDKLTDLLEKMNITPTELLRKNDKAYKELDFKNTKYSEEEVLNYLVENPNLVQRPIVELGDKAVLARPVEKINDLF